MRLLGHAGMRRIFANNSNDDDDDLLNFSGWRTRRRPRREPRPLEKVPSDNGKELMSSGKFGGNDIFQDTLKRKKKVAYRLMHRELGLGSYGRQRNINSLVSQV